MSPHTAFVLLVAGVSLLMLDTHSPRLIRAGQALALGIGIYSIGGILAYMLESRTLYQLSPNIAMAFNSAICALLLAAALLLAKPERGLMTVISGSGVGATLARRLLPAIILLLPIASVLRFWGEREGLYDSGTGVTIMALGCITILTAVVWGLAASLEGADARRRESEHRVQQLHEDLRNRAQLLEAANRELEAFSYSVSHDLRAPLRHINGYVDLLQKKAGPSLDERSHRYLSTIADSARQMGRLIDDLLSFSRMGRAELRSTQVDANGMVAELIQSLGPESEGRDIQWVVQPLPEVQADPDMLRQVFANLFSNAVKYTRQRQRARIEVGCDGASNGELVFHVRDNGAGFEMQYAHKLFGIFQRLHHADQFEGTGIGLANVRRIIHRHDGRAWAEGEPDKGATFYFTLPTSKQQTDTASNEKTETHTAG